MTLRDFINKLLGRQPASATTAKQRLQLVLAHDRSDLNPELLEQMRREILEVVSRYVEIDIEEGDVSLETEDRVTALVANLPIRRTKPLPQQESEPSPDDAEAEADPVWTATQA
ncbi:MAG: cell division topological specificity factor MinE [Vulcanococcus sp.]|jgi:cell division topological specificity factor